MAASPFRSRLVTTLILGGSLVVTIGYARAEDRVGGEEASSRPDTPTPWIFGARYCAQCHAHPENTAAESVICRMNESTTWQARDKHRNAYALLKGPRGLRMGELLKIDVATDRACLNCHSIVVDAGPNVGKETLPAPVRTQQFDRTGDGVSCVVCHGAFRDWVFEHTAFEDPRWRGLTRKEKERRHGMVDLWNPVTRSAKCLSCHIGKVEEGKVLTHAMYAAGHPPLPGIEVATFSEAMPRHWESLREKKTGGRPEVRRTLEGMLDLNKLERTELVAISGVMVLRESMRLFESHAAKDRPEIPGLRWPDFARFDCYACHHDVNRPSWRQARGFAGVPGRPPAPSWPSALVSLGIEAADTDRAEERRAQLDRGLHEFHAALTVRPFGDRERSVAAARVLSAWADEMIGTLSRATISRPAASRMLQRICRMEPAEVPDYDTARQLFWAFQAIYDELELEKKPDGPIASILHRLDDSLGFGLPSAGLPTPIEETLEKRLRAVNAYEPAAFLAGLTELSRQLPGPPSVTTSSKPENASSR